MSNPYGSNLGTTSGKVVVIPRLFPLITVLALSVLQQQTDLALNVLQQMPGLCH